MSRSRRERWARYNFTTWYSVTPKPAYPEHSLTRVLEGPENAGEWDLALLDGQICIVLCCPLCGIHTTLRTTTHSLTFHSDASTFSVSPSVKCPKCPWHTFIIKSKWNEVPLALVPAPSEKQKSTELPVRTKQPYSDYMYPLDPRW